MRTTPLPPLAALILLGAVAGADVLVVGGPTPHHGTIQAAVDAAADGDVVLVWPGSYGAFTIFDKTVTVVARDPGVALTGMVRVQEMAAHRRVTLVDLDVTGNGERALRLADCLGAVRVHGGAYRGTNGLPYTMDVNDGVYASDCDDVAITAATLVGGHGSSNPLTENHSDPGGPGGNGLLVERSRVALHDCALTGGNGGWADFDSGEAGGRGGSGALLRHDGYLLASGCSFTGGQGGRGANEHWTCPTFGGGGGGSGGHGLWLHELTGTGAVSADLIAFSANPGSGGQGGTGLCGPNGSNGAPGQPIFAQGSAVATQHPWPARRLAGPGLWRAGQAAALTLHGEPGDFVLLLRSPRAGFVPDLAKKGVLLVGGLPQVLPLGAIGPSGVLTRTLQLPPAPPGFPGATVQLQAWMVSPAGGAHLTGAAPAAIVPPAL